MSYRTVYLMCIVHIRRPLINHKLEDKVCGEGPDLEAIFQADTDLQGLCQGIKVSRMCASTVCTYVI